MRIFLCLCILTSSLWAAQPYERLDIPSQWGKFDDIRKYSLPNGKLAVYAQRADFENAEAFGYYLDKVLLAQLENVSVLKLGFPAELLPEKSRLLIDHSIDALVLDIETPQTPIAAFCEAFLRDLPNAALRTFFDPQDGRSVHRPSRFAILIGVHRVHALHQEIWGQEFDQFDEGRLTCFRDERLFPGGWKPDLIEKALPELCARMHNDSTLFLAPGITNNFIDTKDDDFVRLTHAIKDGYGRIILPYRKLPFFDRIFAQSLKDLSNEVQYNGETLSAESSPLNDVALVLGSALEKAVFPLPYPIDASMEDYNKALKVWTAAVSFLGVCYLSADLLFDTASGIATGSDMPSITQALTPPVVLYCYLGYLAMLGQKGRSIYLSTPRIAVNSAIGSFLIALPLMVLYPQFM